MKPEEFIGRMTQVYDYLLSAKDALLEGKEENGTLSEKVKELTTALDFKNSMKFNFGTYWTVDGGPFCQFCWEHDGKAVRLVKHAPVRQLVRVPAIEHPDKELGFTCIYHTNVVIGLPADVEGLHRKLVEGGLFS